MLFLGGTMTAVLVHYTDPPETVALYERILGAIKAVGRADRFDDNYGGRLVRAFNGAGLVNIASEVNTPLVAGGTVEGRSEWPLPRVHSGVEGVAASLEPA